METDRLKGVLEDLFSLEVNTIVKSNMTAAKMPNIPTALIDIATEYGVKLRHLTGKTPTRAFAGEASLDVLEEIRKMAADHVASREPKPKGSGAGEVEPSAWEGPNAEEEADLLMLCRIRDNAERLKVVFKGKESLSFDRDKAEEMSAAELPLTEKQKLMIRKIWELGTEEVAMQTVIYLDGDVITRLQPQYYLEAEKQGLISMHSKSVETGISFWGNLVRFAETFVAVLLGAKG